MSHPHTSGYAGALDQGTTSTRFIVFDRHGEIIARSQKEHAQICPRPGWVEHDAVEIWNNTREVISMALGCAGLTARDLAAIGITNQRETTLVWDRRTGIPVHHALVWQDTRVSALVEEYARDGGPDRFRHTTGLPLASYFSALKLQWLLDNVPGARSKAAAGDVLFGTMDSWLLWNLTGGVRGGLHLTDVTNASRTQLVSLKTLDWDPELLDAFRIPKTVLPRIVSPGIAREPRRARSAVDHLVQQSAQLLAFLVGEAGTDELLMRRNAFAELAQDRLTTRRQIQLIAPSIVGCGGSLYVAFGNCTCHMQPDRRALEPYQSCEIRLAHARLLRQVSDDADDARRNFALADHLLERAHHHHIGHVKVQAEHRLARGTQLRLDYSARRESRRSLPSSDFGAARCLR
jgi:hypothetical protein